MSTFYGIVSGVFLLWLSYLTYVLTQANNAITTVMKVMMEVCP